MRINTKVVSDILTGEVLERRSFEHIGKIAKAMGVRLFSVFTTTFVGPLPANATETVVLTTPAIQLAVDNAAVILVWMATVLLGTGTTSLGWRLRRGTTTAGTFIGAAAWLDAATAATSNVTAGMYVDTPGVVAGQQYSLTIVQTGASASGTWSDGCLLAMVL